jgi:transposase-like protein
MGRRGHPAESRRKALDLVEAGRPVAEVAKALGISDRTIHTWRRQDRIDKGLEPGLTSAEESELAAARQRISQLEAELAVHRRASELLATTVYPAAAGPPGRPDSLWRRRRVTTVGSAQPNIAAICLPRILTSGP